MTAFKLDGVEYPSVHVTSLKRSFSILDGPNSGRALSGDMIRDVIGTYYNYSIDVKPDSQNPEEYDTFYEEVSAPVDYHIMEFPYGQTMYSFKAYVTSGDDSIIIKGEDNTLWAGLTLNFIAMSPKRRPV